MCDIEKYRKIYKEIEKLDAEDTMQLILESEDEDTKEFYEVVGNYLFAEKTESSN